LDARRSIESILRLLGGKEGMRGLGDEVKLIGGIDEEPDIVGVVFFLVNRLFEGVMEEIVP
jgi:hypothetical protein